MNGVKWKIAYVSFAIAVMIIDFFSVWLWDFTDAVHAVQPPAYVKLSQLPKLADKK